MGRPHVDEHPPGIPREVGWQEAWGPYMGRAKTGNIVVDGGVLSNWPIRLIAEPAPETRAPRIQ